MIKYKKVHSAFSLIEVIFVLVILGIISSIGSSIIVQVYESYITQNAVYKVNTKTELVANQIVNRLSYAIPGTVISKDLTKHGTVEGTDWIQLKNIPAIDTNFTTVEWIGYDNDSFSARRQPSWTGLANYETSTQNLLNTPGSNLGFTATVMNNLSKVAGASTGKVRLTQSKPAAIIFHQRDNYYNNSEEYSPACMGLIDNNTSCIWPVRRVTNTQLAFTRLNEPKIITERYKLAWSAYALVPIDTPPVGDGLFDIFLHDNYQPWNNEMFDDATTPKSLLMKNVSVFKFTENGGILQFKLCVQENIGGTFPISTCKEKVVLR